MPLLSGQWVKTSIVWIKAHVKVHLKSALEGRMFTTSPVRCDNQDHIVAWVLSAVRDEQNETSDGAG